MIKFESQYEEGAPKVIVELSSDSDLTDVLTAFGGFLRATGFGFHGEVTISEDE